MHTFEHVTHLSQVSRAFPTVLAIGVFDGVHLGHQRLLQQMVGAAQLSGARAAVLTFFPHPAEVIHGLGDRLYLTTLEERIQRLQALGVDLVITHPFNEEVRQTRAADFVEQLRRFLDLRQLWGGSFSLGYQREGTYDYLRALGTHYGFTVHGIADLAILGGERVSSSRIRQSLQAGDLADVNACLGRRFGVTGRVVTGRRLGHTIGFPTANLHIWERQLLPAYGVYAAYAWLGDDRYGAAVNVGVRPTVDGQQLTVEAHLLDFEGNVYDHTLRLEFEARIRPEMKFNGLDDLRAQIARDVDTIRSIVAAGRPAPTD